MSIDTKIIEILKKKLANENQNDGISKVLENWLKELDDGKKDLNQEDKIKAILDKLNV
tara:strand:+ start:2441 stop:2614 length:174 start_codon:yes stop_codon:yes gene_type:complete